MNRQGILVMRVKTNGSPVNCEDDQIRPCHTFIVWSYHSSWCIVVYSSANLHFLHFVISHLVQYNIGRSFLKFFQNISLWKKTLNTRKNSPGIILCVSRRFRAVGYCSRWLLTQYRECQHAYYYSNWQNKRNIWLIP